jgi:hypothetical protein
MSDSADFSTPSSTPVEPPPPTPPGGSLRTVAATLGASEIWVRIVAYVAAGSVALMVLMGLLMGVAGLVSGQPAMGLLILVYPLFALIYVPPAMYLFRYARQIKAFVGTGQLGALELAVDAQRSFWKYCAILMLIGIGLSVVVVGLAVVAGAFAAIGAARS